MGCGSCGTGTPNGCKSNGGCSTGGCNRMNVHDWLMNLPFSDPESTCKIIEVSFNQGSRKDFFRNPTLQYFEKGELVTLEGVSGFDVGEVSLSGELVRMQISIHINNILKRNNNVSWYILNSKILIYKELFIIKQNRLKPSLNSLLSRR